ncbi:MAG TPA: glycosyltransferase family 9 protein [Phycisphaerae bacterium]|nr:glycosyltransferase family 9 protein [Phycisphaerae bacterium]
MNQHTHPPTMQNPRRMLIIKPSSLGDVTTALPLLCDLKKRFPNAQIDWMIHPLLTDLIQGHDALNEIIPFDRDEISGWWFKPHAMNILRQLVGKLRQNKYDVIFDAQGLLRSALLAWLSGARVRIGAADAREGAVWFYTHKVNISREEQLAVVRMRSLQTPFGPVQGSAEFRMPVQSEALAGVKKLIPANKPVAAIIPGARWHAKRWSEEGFIQIGHHLTAEHFCVLILGDPRERDLCEQIVTRIGPNAVNLAGRTSLAQMVAAIWFAKIVIGNDSGPLHVAAALGRSLVGLYGPTDPASVGPYGQMDHVLHFQQSGDYRNNQVVDRSAALASLPAEKVWELIQGILVECR